jgi:hypothetical protein
MEEEEYAVAVFMDQLKKEVSTRVVTLPKTTINALHHL